MEIADATRRALMETMSQCVMLVDDQGRIRYANRACEQLMDRSADGLCRMSLHELVPDGQGKAGTELLRVLEAESERPGAVKQTTDTLTLMRNNGERVSVGVTAQPFHGTGPGELLLELGVRHRASYLQKVSEQIPGVLYEVEDHGDDLYFSFVSDGYEELAGPSGELSYPESMQDIHPDDRDEVIEKTFAAIEERRSFQAEYRYLRDDGSVVWARAQSEPYQKSDGTYAWIGVITDITELKNTQQSLEEAVSEKETLIREVHHRVKSNLGIISSMLKLERNSIEDPDVRGSLEECLQRVQSMSLVHKMLHDGQKLDQLHLQSYAERLIDQVWNSYRPDDVELSLDVSVADQVIPLDTAIPVGLIINELLSNALQHGYQGCTSGTVRVHGHRDDQHYELQIADDGIGLSEDFDPETTGGLGVRLVQSLVRSNLQGEMNVQSGSDGTTVEVRFPC